MRRERYLLNSPPCWRSVMGLMRNVEPGLQELKDVVNLLKTQEEGEKERLEAEIAAVVARQGREATATAASLGNDMPVGGGPMQMLSANQLLNLDVEGQIRATQTSEGATVTIIKQVSGGTEA